MPRPIGTKSPHTLLERIMGRVLTRQEAQVFLPKKPLRA